MKHKFQNPLLKHIVRELIRLDLEETQDKFAKPDAGIVQGNAEAACKGCNDCKCCGTEGTTEYLSVREYAEEFSITLGTGALTEMTNAAMKESVRQKQGVGEANGALIFHPDVLAKVFGPLLKMLNRV